MPKYRWGGDEEDILNMLLTRKDMVKPYLKVIRLIILYVYMYISAYIVPHLYTRELMDLSAYQCPFIQPEFSGGLIGFFTGHPYVPIY